MKVLVDTNVLLRAAQKQSPSHSVAVNALETLHEQNYTLCIVPQVVFEYWVVGTRPVENNGLGLTTTAASVVIDSWLSEFPLLADQPDLFITWKRLVCQHDIKGKRAHDARLVAAMTTYDVSNLLTFNSSDFASFEHINVLSPDQIASRK